MYIYSQYRTLCYSCEEPSFSSTFSGDSTHSSLQDPPEVSAKGKGSITHLLLVHHHGNLHCETSPVCALFGKNLFKSATTSCFFSSNRNILLWLSLNFCLAFVLASFFIFALALPRFSQITCPEPPIKSTYSMAADILVSRLLYKHSLEVKQIAIMVT